MINHVRTLLLNLDGPRFDPSIPGEEIVGEYTARAMSSVQKLIRFALFGSNPDRHILNWRLWQLIQAIRTSSLREELMRRDKRLTSLAREEDWMRAYPFAYGSIRFSQNGSLKPLWYIPDDSMRQPVADTTGHVVWRWTVTIDTSNGIARVEGRSPDSKSTETPINFHEGYSIPAIYFPPMNWYVAWPEQDATWDVTILVKPQYRLDTLVTHLENVASHEIRSMLKHYPDLLPYWTESEFDPIEKMAALALGLAYDLEDGHTQ
jgi:hypothetical protein